MAIIDEQDFEAQLTVALGTAGNLLPQEGTSFASQQAMNELGWSYPVNDSRKVYWGLQRARRHALELLMIEAAHKFRYKQIHLDHRYKHYKSVIEYMDLQFQKALEQDPVLEGIDGKDYFGVYISNGFVYDQFGNNVSRIFKDLNVDNRGYRKAHVYRT